MERIGLRDPAVGLPERDPAVPAIDRLLEVEDDAVGLEAPAPGALVARFASTLTLTLGSSPALACGRSSWAARFAAPAARNSESLASARS